MKRIDRYALIDRIGRELQSRMGYSDIDVYLSGFGVDCNKETSNVNSKWVYVKDLLKNIPDETVLNIADELEIEHGFSLSRKFEPLDSKFWMAGYFRLFISHISAFKVRTAQLQHELKKKYAISSFVAHEDIEPTKEWQDEIEKALFSMDALTAILTTGFDESKWTDQEVGVAIGRDVLIVPIRKGLDPYGFIAKYQGLQGNGKTVGEVAKAVFQIVANHLKTKGKMADVLVEQILFAKSEDDAVYKLSLIDVIEKLPERHLEKLHENIRDNTTLLGSERFLFSINQLFEKYGMSKITNTPPVEKSLDDNIPF